MLSPYPKDVIPTVTYNCEFQKLNIIKDALNNHFHS